MSKEYKMYINGEWVGAQDGEVYDDLNPYTGDVFAKVSAGKAADAQKAIDAAAMAFSAWSHTLPAERQALILKADRNVTHGIVVRVMDTAKSCGIKKLIIGTKKDK